MGSEYTEAQKRATEKYMEGRKTLRVVVTESEHKQIRARADSMGVSMNGYIKRLIENDLQGIKDAADMAQLIIEGVDEEELMMNVSCSEYLQNVKRIIDRNRAEREKRKKGE